MTVTELTLDQLQHIAGASSLTSNPVAAHEARFASGRLFTPDELKICSEGLCRNVPNGEGYQPTYSL